MNTKIRFVSLLAGVAILAAACGTSTATTAPSTSTAPASSAPESMAAESPSASAASPSAPSAAPLSGELTVWHSYGSGGGELGAFLKILGSLEAANKDLKVNVVEQPFADIFNGWNTDVAAGNGPDMFIAPNDSLYSQQAAGVLADLTDKLTGKLDGFSQVAVDGSKVDGKFYMVPESLKAVALWYDKSAIPTPPTTTDALLAAVKDGSIKLGLNEGIYHNFGWTGAFGGTLMDDSGKCVADQAGFSDAFAYLQALKAAGAKFYSDGNVQKQDFQTGKINATVDGPWQTADFTKALGDKLAVTKMPAGPSGSKANPFTGTDGWYINPNSKNIDLAVEFALQFVGTANEQIFSDEGGHVPAAPGVKIDNPLVQSFSDAAADGLARPQNAQFGNFWGPFGDALTKAIEKGGDAKALVAAACKSMNDASGIK